MLAAMLVAVGLTVQAASPTIKEGRPGFFTITFDKGAVWACTVFRMVEPTEKDLEQWPDGHYAPRSCGDLSKDMTSYVEEFSPYIFDPRTGQPYNVDWDVYAEIGYPVPDSNTVSYVETNRVRTHR